jgi:hypothetical protein
MYDSWDDSWEGAEFCINSDCATIGSGEDGAKQDFCVDMGAANTITMGGGYCCAGEHTWELHDANDALLLSGGDPYNACFGNCGIGGCMESDCPEYSSDATYDDGSCSADDCAGVCGGGSVEDACGDCGGDGSAHAEVHPAQAEPSPPQSPQASSTLPPPQTPAQSSAEQLPSSYVASELYSGQSDSIQPPIPQLPKQAL